MRALVFIFIIGLILSCDTERNIPLLPQDTFLKFYGVEGEQTGVDFVLTADNALVMVGNSTMPGQTQMIYVVKVDLLGNVIWENMIGLADKNNTVKDIELHPDGRLIIAGETEMVVGNRDVFVSILDGSGVELDSTRYGFIGGSDEEVTSVTIMQPGLNTNVESFIVSGSTNFNQTAIRPRDTKDGMHIRFIDSPSLPRTPNAWTEITGKNDSEDVITKIIQIDSENLYCFGYTNAVANSSGDFKYWIFSLSDNGGPSGDALDLFDEFGQLNEDEILKAVIDVDISNPFDRGFLLVGNSFDNNGGSRSYVVKLKRDLTYDIGNESYPTPLGIVSNSKLRGNGIYNAFTNDYLILATQNSNPNLAEDISLFKLNRENQLEWGPQVFGGESFDEAGAVLQLPDGKIMVLGTMTVGGLNGQKKMALMKLNSEGKLLR